MKMKLNNACKDVYVFSTVLTQMSTSIFFLSFLLQRTGTQGLVCCFSPPFSLIPLNLEGNTCWTRNGVKFFFLLLLSFGVFWP